MNSKTRTRKGKDDKGRRRRWRVKNVNCIVNGRKNYLGKNQCVILHICTGLNNRSVFCCVHFIQFDIMENKNKINKKWKIYIFLCPTHMMEVLCTHIFDGVSTHIFFFILLRVF